MLTIRTRLPNQASAARDEYDIMIDVRGRHDHYGHRLQCGRSLTHATSNGASCRVRSPRKIKGDTSEGAPPPHVDEQERTCGTDGAVSAPHIIVPMSPEPAEDMWHVGPGSMSLSGQVPATSPACDAHRQVDPDVAAGRAGRALGRPTWP